MWRRYISYLIAGLVGLFALVGAINVAVDPYGLLGTREISGFNVIKPAATTRTRIAKPVQGERANPRTLILGNSRPEMGLDPESAVWSSDQRPVYNAAIPGASVYMAMRFGQNLLFDGHPTLILWGLDFADFLIGSDSALDQCRWPPTPGEWEKGLTVSQAMLPSKEWRLERLKHYGVSILSTQALFDSIATISAQQRKGSGTRTMLGFNSARDYGPIIRAEGQYVLFAQKNAEMESRLHNKEWSIVAEGCGSSVDFRSVAEFLQLAKESEARVILFINPYHEDYLETIWRAGLWPLFEDWKRRLRALSDDGGVEALWDFGLLNEFTSEDPPPPGDKRTTLRWFWEPAHYRSELGDLMLIEMLQSNEETRRSPGMRLTTEYLEAHLSQQRLLAKAAFGQASLE
jgi:hypothetical protein